MSEQFNAEIRVHTLEGRGNRAGNRARRHRIHRSGGAQENRWCDRGPVGGDCRVVRDPYVRRGRSGALAIVSIYGQYGENWKIVGPGGNS